MYRNKDNCIKVTFDKKEIQSRIQKFTYRQARRHAGDLYKALVQELYEDGCLTTAKYFQIFVAKEHYYYTKKIIGDRVVDHPTLLMFLYDNCKMAERKALLQRSEGLPMTFKLLYQIMLLLEEAQYVAKFSWLQNDIYRVVAKIGDKLGPGNSRVEKSLANIYHKYANLLSKETETMTLALAYYQKAIGLALGNLWLSDESNSDSHTYSYLHTVAGHNYVEALLKFGKTIANTDYLQAVALAHKALCTLTQVGQERHNLLLCVNVHLHMAEFYMEGERYDMAYKVLNKASDNMITVDKQNFEKLALRLHMDKGICCTNLNQTPEAMESFRQALTLSQKLKIKSAEGQIHMSIGNLYEVANQRHLAKKAYLNSKKIFENLNDLENRKRSIYHLAQTMSRTIFPLFMDLIKSSEKDGHFFHLRRWKYQLQRFWINQYIEGEDHDELQRLIEEFVVPPKVKDLLNI